jgi:hypothetical protein
VKLDLFKLNDEELMALAETAPPVSRDVYERIKRRIEIRMLASNEEFLRALAWEVDDRDIDISEHSSRRCQGPPSKSRENE